MTDVDELAVLFASWQGRFEQVSPGRFECQVGCVQGRVGRGLCAGFSHVIQARGWPGPGWVTVCPVLPVHAATRWHGRRHDAGRVVFNGPDVGVDHTTGRRSEDLALTLPADALGQAARALLRAEPDVLRSESVAAAPPPERAERLEQLLRAWVGLGAEDPTLPGSAEGLALEQECVRAAVACVFQDSPHAAAEARAPNRARLVSRAEEMMRAALRQPLGAVDLCGALGVSDRTLRLAFRERYGLGPMAYCRVLRLNAVRAALKAGEPGTASVAGVARAWGFHHLGNFAADYRRHFRELPSATLRAGRGPHPLG